LRILKLIKTQHSIKRLKKEASIDVAEENYQQALKKFDEISIGEYNYLCLYFFVFKLDEFIDTNIKDVKKYLYVKI
jgi:hypothetical protein